MVAERAGLSQGSTIDLPSPDGKFHGSDDPIYGLPGPHVSGGMQVANVHHVEAGDDLKPETKPRSGSSPSPWSRPTPSRSKSRPGNSIT